MITRRSFFSGLVAALVAPPIVRKAFDRFGWHSFHWKRVPGGWTISNESEITDLLKARINDAYRVTQRNMAESMYNYSATNPPALRGLRPLWLRETLMEQSERHFQRAAYWRIQGKPDYAMGSLYKAARAEDRARSLLA